MGSSEQIGVTHPPSGLEDGHDSQEAGRGLQSSSIFRKLKSFEARVWLFALLLALPGMVISAIFLWFRPWALPFRFGLIAAELLLWWRIALALLRCVTRPLQILSNMVAALRVEDYSFRARHLESGDALGQLLLELNALADVLAEQRISAIEATALLKRVVDEIDVPLFAFDPKHLLRLVNPAGERLLKRSSPELLGRSATELKIHDCLSAKSGALIALGATGPDERWLVRRSSIRQKGVAHTLVVLSDVSQALREEERRAWQRLIRVLGHELNNSLTPIKSIAGSLGERIRSAPLSQNERQEFEHGLEIIEARAASLNRFLQAYRQLAQLPPPALRQAELGPIITRVAGLETRVAVMVHQGPNLTLRIDPDQVEQMLINLVRNAADAALEANTAKGSSASGNTAPQVFLTWALEDSKAVITIDDNGPGLLNPGNAFVPFYTTKPQGTGTGLLLARQIVEAHGGSLTLRDRYGERGCQATITFGAKAP